MRVIYNDLLVEMDDQIMIVKLNRPEVLNALREKTLLELIAVFDKFAEDTQMRVVILTGMGDRAFSALDAT
jgi:enoyl-CoA hydratase/carnithine racemase